MCWLLYRCIQIDSLTESDISHQFSELGLHNYNYYIYNILGVADLICMDGCYGSNDTAIFTCTVNDETSTGGTVWSGTALNCPNNNPLFNNRIYLPHYDFNLQAYGTCNGVRILSESVGVNGSLYSSNLTITAITPDMNGQTIVCSLSGISIVGIKTLKIGGMLV